MLLIIILTILVDFHQKVKESFKWEHDGKKKKIRDRFWKKLLTQEDRIMQPLSFPILLDLYLNLCNTGMKQVSILSCEKQEIND